MPLADILTHLQSVVDGVVGAGRTHVGLRRFAAPEMDFAVGQDPTWDVPHLHIWFVTRGTSNEESLTIGSHLRSTAVTLNAFYQLFDAGGGDDPAATQVGTVMSSEVDFSALVERVCDAIRNDGALHGGGVAIGCSPPAVSAWNATQIAEIDCHHAVISLSVDEELLVDFGG